MKKGLLLFSLLVVLAAPAMAAPRDDDPHGGRQGWLSRIVRMLKALDDIVAGPPKP